MMRLRIAIVLALALITQIAFQNCSQVNFGTSSTDASANAQAAAAGGANGTVTQGSVGAQAAGSLRDFRPILAVAGLNCMGCHGVVNGNVITDFGVGSGNFSRRTDFFGGSRTAYNDVQDGWGSFNVTGSILIPKLALSGSDAKAMANFSSAMSFSTFMQTGHSGSNETMVDHVTPSGGAAKVIEYSQVSIGYPSQSEILSLAPAALSGQAVGVATIAVANQPASSMSGFAVDSSGQFVRNATATVQCYGDVVVKGPLFLNNVTIQTDANGCRLYVTQSVFVQGPINYVGNGAANLQISSARAVIMGMSAERLGYAGSGASSLRTSDAKLTTVGGPWPRFTADLDGTYSPNATVNGVDRTTFFESIIIDAVAIGAEMKDAGDSAATNNLVAGETTVYEPATGDNGNISGSRVSLNYNHLLLNAPHVHSRYAGTFSGSIIADVAMLARNPANLSIEQFTFDPLLGSLDSVLPALKTKILVLQK